MRSPDQSSSSCLLFDKDTITSAGHLNSETVKGVSFMGVADEYVVSGSDCGHVYIWSKQDGKLQKLVKGDRSVVNCLEPHPYLPATLATSGEPGLSSQAGSTHQLSFCDSLNILLPPTLC